MDSWFLDVSILGSRLGSMGTSYGDGFDRISTRPERADPKRLAARYQPNDWSVGE
jgi:hypothetical protein